MEDFGKSMADRLKNLNPNNLPTATGIGWYKREDYPRLLKIFEDSDELPETFDEWESLAKKTQQSLTVQGMRVIRVMIDPDTFPKWCASEGIAIDKHARMRYGNLKAAEVLKEEINNKK